jgi:hypothetical protein
MPYNSRTVVAGLEVYEGWEHTSITASLNNVTQSVLHALIARRALPSKKVGSYYLVPAGTRIEKREGQKTKWWVV